jgi:hypothetical protein
MKQLRLDQLNHNYVRALGIDPDKITDFLSHSGTDPIIHKFVWSQFTTSTHIVLYEADKHILAAVGRKCFYGVQFYPIPEFTKERHVFLLQELVENVIPEELGIDWVYPRVSAESFSNAIILTDYNEYPKVLTQPFIAADADGDLLFDEKVPKENDYRNILIPLMPQKKPTNILFEKFPQFSNVEKEGGSITREKDSYVITHPEIDEPITIKIGDLK